jgi:hypothetical protein
MDSLNPLSTSNSTRFQSHSILSNWAFKKLNKFLI